MTTRLNPRHRRPSSSGQAMIETILITWSLIMVLAIIFQGFLIDQHAYRLATRAHAQLFKAAYSGNLATRSYQPDYTEKLQGADEYVPVVGFFRMYGMTREDLRIRSPYRPPFDPAKRIIIGRGTAASVTDGLIGTADPSSYLAEIAEGFQKLQDAKTKIEQAKSAATTKGGRK